MHTYWLLRSFQHTVIIISFISRQWTKSEIKVTFFSLGTVSKHSKSIAQNFIFKLRIENVWMNGHWSVGDCIRKQSNPFSTVIEFLTVVIENV